MGDAREDRLQRIEVRLDRIVEQLSDLIGEVQGSRAATEGLQARLALVEAELKRIREFELRAVRAEAASQADLDALREAVDDLRVNPPQNRSVGRREAIIGGGGAVGGAATLEALHAAWRAIQAWLSSGGGGG